jgi:sodium transport system permease protein
MRWANVRTIFCREVRDQVRDQRTLFMVFVLPILLYPILVMGMIQVRIAFEDKPREVILLGAQYLPDTPALLNANRDGFNPELYEGTASLGKLRVRVEPSPSNWDNPGASRVGIRQGFADAVLRIPPDVSTQLEKEKSAKIPVDYVSADERSQLTYLRVREILHRWNEKIVQGRLEKDHKSIDYVEPVHTTGTDLATSIESGGMLWARIFPFLLVVMSLTGAFYPAIDMCAGEKERGTMETLLISPASRTEIVIGKFLTVVLASMTTAVLNLLSMGLTGLGLATKMMGSGLEPPTLMAGFWIALLLIPLSVFFSAVCLALAVLAKSMKEGQYYLTPLYMISLPLILLTLLPGVELSPFYSMVPITGVGLLLKSLMLGEYGKARVYFIPVLIPMIIYGIVALRWAIDQFRREDVLFRGSERFEPIAWARYMIRHKEETPTGSQALLCFTLMLCVAWFAMQALGERLSPLVLMGAGHLIFVLMPPVAMAFLLTSSPAKTLRLRMPDSRYFWLAAGLALTLNPLVRELGAFIARVFPPSRMVAEQMGSLVKQIPNLGVAVFLFALIPSITEEVAFRGFILSGLERGHRTRTAILISALLFGFLHVLLSMFNQLFTATLLGLVLGLMAIRSRSLYPGIVFHFLNNSLALLIGTWIAHPDSGLASWFFRDLEHGLFQWPVLAVSGGVSAWLLLRLYDGSRQDKPAAGFTSAWAAGEGL